MKTIGLLGGMSWESTVSNYQIINRLAGRTASRPRRYARAEPATSARRSAPCSGSGRSARGGIANHVVVRGHSSLDPRTTCSPGISRRYRRCGPPSASATTTPAVSGPWTWSPPRERNVYVNVSCRF